VFEEAEFCVFQAVFAMDTFSMRRNS